MERKAQHEFLRSVVRVPVAPPTRVHRDAKKEQSKTKCRSKIDN